MKKFTIVMLVLALALSAVFAQGQTEAVASSDDNKAIKGEVNAYIASSDDYCLELKERFEKDYPGLKFNYVLLGGGEIFTRLEGEKNSPQADFITGGGADSYIRATNKGLLMDYTPDYVKENYPDWAYSDTYVVHSTNILGICYDKTWYDANNLPYPTKWDDLLIPELKKNVITTNPATSTTGYMMVCTLIANRGEEEGLKYMFALDKDNIKSYEKGGTGPVNKIALGEAAAGMCYISFAIDLQEKGYTNLGVVVPEDGTGLEEGCGALVANCKNEECAKIFYDWWTEHNSEVALASGVFNWPCDRNAKMHEGNEVYSEQLNSGRNANVDYFWCAENKDRILSIWDKGISNK